MGRNPVHTHEAYKERIPSVGSALRLACLSCEELLRTRSVAAVAATAASSPCKQAAGKLALPLQLAESPGGAHGNSVWAFADVVAAELCRIAVTLTVSHQPEAWPVV